GRFNVEQGGGEKKKTQKTGKRGKGRTPGCRDGSLPSKPARGQERDSRCLVGWWRGGLVSLTIENIFGVRRPDPVVRLLVGEGTGARGVAGHHVEAGIGQFVEGLLQEGEFEVVPGRVPLRGPVGVPALVQGVPKNLLGQRGLAAHHDPSHPAELGVRLAVPAQRVGAAVADGDEAGSPPLAAGSGGRGAGRGRGQAPAGVGTGGRLLGVALARVIPQGVLLAELGRQQLHQLGQHEELGLPLQPPALREVLGQHQLPVPHEIQDVAEQEAVPVHEEAALAVAGQRARVFLREHLPEQRAGHAEQREVPGDVHLSPHVQLDDVGERGPAVAAALRAARGVGQGHGEIPLLPPAA
ncbi:hypothetical protein Nmel_013286, partial [Mimus melanotis]